MRKRWLGSDRSHDSSLTRAKIRRWLSDWRCLAAGRQYDVYLTQLDPQCPSCGWGIYRTTELDAVAISRYSSAAMADQTNADVQRLTDAVNRVGVRLRECPSCGHVDQASLGTTVVLPDIRVDLRVRGPEARNARLGV